MCIRDRVNRFQLASAALSEPCPPVDPAPTDLNVPPYLSPTAARLSSSSGAPYLADEPQPRKRGPRPRLCLHHRLVARREKSLWIVAELKEAALAAKHVFSVKAAQAK